MPTSAPRRCCSSAATRSTASPPPCSSARRSTAKRSSWSWPASRCRRCHRRRPHPRRPRPRGPRARRRRPRAVPCWAARPPSPPARDTPELADCVPRRCRVAPGVRIEGHGSEERGPRRAAGVVAGAARAVKLTPLAAHTPEAVRAALAARGWDTQPAWFAATGMQALVVLLEEITEAEREALVRWGAKGGADVLTGDGWALVGAPASRLAPLARPDRLRPGLERLAPELGRFLASYADPPRRWALGGGSALDLHHPVLIGIVNVTPDSFSDGGHFATVDRAVAQAERLVADGCELLDVGGESTRPGSAPVPVDEEIGRVAPVIEQLVRRGLGPVSVDTRKAAVARAALAAGAAVVNDVSGLAFDAALAGVVGAAGAGMIVMHMRGTPDTMDSLAVYRHVAADVAAELGAAAARAEAGGVARELIVVDPGFGFAKTPEQNFRLLDELATVVGLGYPVAVGP